MATTTIRETFDSDEIEDLKDEKGDRTWRETILMEIAGYSLDEVHDSGEGE